METRLSRTSLLAGKPNSKIQKRENVRASSRQRRTSEQWTIKNEKTRESLESDC